VGKGAGMLQSYCCAVTIRGGLDRLPQGSGQRSGQTGCHSLLKYDTSSKGSLHYPAVKREQLTFL
jgi:hypothetical protein